MGVIVKEALANGRLTHRSPDIARRLENSVPGFGPDAIALAAALANPWADVVLSGAATPGQLADNLTALEVPSSALADLPNMAEDSGQYWAIRSRARLDLTGRDRRLISQGTSAPNAPIRCRSSVYLEVCDESSQVGSLLLGRDDRCVHRERPNRNDAGTGPNIDHVGANRHDGGGGVGRRDR